MSEYFGTLGIAMWTLGFDGAMQYDPKSVLIGLRRTHSWIMVIVFVNFLLLSCMTVMNMLVGVLCEVVSAVKVSEEEAAAVALMKGTLLIMLKRLDKDNSGEISRSEFLSVPEDDEAMQALTELEVDIDYFLQLT